MVPVSRQATDTRLSSILLIFRQPILSSTVPDPRPFYQHAKEYARKEFIEHGYVCKVAEHPAEPKSRTTKTDLLLVMHFKRQFFQQPVEPPDRHKVQIVVPHNPIFVRVWFLISFRIDEITTRLVHWRVV